MARMVRGALIQATLSEPGDAPIEKIKQSMLDKHVGLIVKAAEKGAQIICLQELFYGPYFCCEQDTKWYGLTEKIPDGPTTHLTKLIGTGRVTVTYKPTGVVCHYRDGIVPPPQVEFDRELKKNMFKT